MKNNEKLRPMERFTPPDSRESGGSKPLDPVRVDQIFMARKEMLHSIKMDIDTNLYEAISAKVEHENTFLIGIVESNAKIVETRKRLNRVLKTEYFIQKPLDANIL